MVWMLHLAACLLWKEPDLVVRPLPTQFVNPGDAVQLDVDGLDDEVEVFLRSRDGTEVPIEAKIVMEELRITVPTTRPGAYTLVLRRGDEEDLQPITIADPNAERACKRPYLVNTGISRTLGVGYIDRFYPDGRRERREIPLEEVEHVEYSYDSMQPCAAIHLRKHDGTALLFEDGLEPLLRRAQQVAAYVDKPLKTDP